MHILIVDDNFINRQYFSMALKKANYTITLAEDGFEAIEKAKITNFDLILMDIRMPDLDGYETTQKIRLLSNHNATPILAISAEALISEKKELFNGFLPKPISPKLLISQIDKHNQYKRSEHKTFDQSSVLTFAYNDKAIMHKLVALFIEDLPKQIQFLASSIEARNTNESMDIIHKIRGSCKTCGAQDLDYKLKQLSRHVKLKNNKATSESYASVKNSAHDYLTFNFENN